MRFLWIKAVWLDKLGEYKWRKHAKNIAKGKMSASYWADKVKW